jgi:hypothetical protein
MHIEMIEPQTPSMTAADFTNSELREAWLGFKRAVTIVEDAVATGKFNSTAWPRLIERHRERVAAIEAAQRALNVHRACEPLY